MDKSLKKIFTPASYLINPANIWIGAILLMLIILNSANSAKPVQLGG